MKIAAPVVEHVDGRIVVRDDLLPGGTKRRALAVLFSLNVEEYVYAGPVFGYAQIALAHAASDAGKLATVFVAERKEPHPRTLAAKAAGAMVVQVPFGRLSNVRKKARVYVEKRGARAALLPFGLDDPAFITELSHVMERTVVPAKGAQLWCAAGSGTITRALQKAFPRCEHHAVLVGTEGGDYGTATVHKALEDFEDDALLPPPFPSCSNYDAKVWRFFFKSPPGSVFWNVGA